MDVKIRKYQTQDLNEVLFVWEESSKIAHPFLKRSFLRKEKRDISDIYLPQAITWVAVHRQNVVGFISLLGNEIGALFILPGYQRSGIGRALITKAQLYHNELEVNVFEENRIGRNFYLKSGFTFIKRSIHDETGNNLLRLKLTEIADYN